MSPTAMPSEPRDHQFLQGVGLFNRGEYFAAHEAWEDLWREATGEEKQFFQGLIQCAVALEHARRGNVCGALRLAERYPRRFAGLSGRFMGLNVPEFVAAMDRKMRSLRDFPAGHAAEIGPPVLPLIEIGRS